MILRYQSVLERYLVQYIGTIDLHFNISMNFPDAQPRSNTLVIDVETRSSITLSERKKSSICLFLKCVIDFSLAHSIVVNLFK